MALTLRDRTRCSLCDQVLQSNDEVFATSHFLAPEHPLLKSRLRVPGIDILVMSQEDAVDA